ncbi:23S rRNA (pseudouridine(1915)-N(3))-methyltransferase RlmH [Staphylospora marina]|uniref:23S rRNA (pseudouridine(1915)-N(3))-methyltransferase RlmH n=1 Tax=Staphylospora marina TaxID=2490858 RepID=UPI000F5BE15B|nr:23S rRNA (pseudouridine(1915)-N(3))-methyltransferase RlmH [Staphylospora marina]
MNIRIVAVGKLKEKYLKAACDEYLKRLGAYARVEVIEVPEEKEDPVHDADIRRLLAKEGERILRHLPEGTRVITLEVDGKSLSSEQFAERLDRLATYGDSRIAFVIGGSHGLSDDVRKRSDFALSFSAMTFPHQLIRVFLLEQIYRAFKINRGETYHK